MAGAESSLDSHTLARLASLEDPVRRRLYEYVRDSEHPVGRDEAATTTGIGRTLAAYHLDKLLDAELLVADYARPPGRTGPGAGRPAKRYTRAEQELSLSVPPRDYQLLAQLLVTSLESDPTGAVRAAVNQAAYDTGHHLATDPETNLNEVLSSCGYQPRTSPNGCIELANCPFHAISQHHQDIVCGLNLQLIEGILSANPTHNTHAELTYPPNRCCVIIHPPQPATHESPSPAASQEG